MKNEVLMVSSPPRAMHDLPETDLLTKLIRNILYRVSRFRFMSFIY